MTSPKDVGSLQSHQRRIDGEKSSPLGPFRGPAGLRLVQWQVYHPANPKANPPTSFSYSWDGRGFFHYWGVESEEVRLGSGEGCGIMQSTVAIVEEEGTGLVKTIIPSMLRFVDV